MALFSFEEGRDYTIAEARRLLPSVGDRVELDTYVGEHIYADDEDDPSEDGSAYEKTLVARYEMLSPSDKHSRARMKRWLKFKIDNEGPPDEEIVARYGEGIWKNAPIFVVAEDLPFYTTPIGQGRHRVAAALKYGVDLPVLVIRKR